MLGLRVLAVAALLAASTTSACTLDFDSIGFTGAGGDGAAAAGGGPPSTSTEKTASTGKPGVCEAGASCVPAPPTGWIGPGFWLDGEGECGPAFTVLLLAGETASVGECPCEPAGPTCTEGVVSYFSTSTCLSRVAPNIPVQPGVCSFVGEFTSTPPQGAEVVGLPMDNAAAMCASPAGFVPEPFLTNPGNLCGLGTGATCGDGFACTPPGEPACIAVLDPTQTGTCPEPYTQPRRVETGQQSCQCAGNPVGSCAGEIELHQDAECRGVVDTIPITIPPECEGIDLGAGQLYAKYVTPRATCISGVPTFVPESWLVCCEP